MNWRRLLRPSTRPRGSAEYWEQRYSQGGSSGSGSYGKFAEAKAEYVNSVIADHGVESVIEFGCGDGNQLRYLTVPRYLGLDVAGSAVERCMAAFKDDGSKSFLWYEPTRLFDPARFLTADMTLSQEVIFHLVEDAVFERYMEQLFGAAQRLVLIVSSDLDWPLGPFERHREWTPWQETHLPEWERIDYRPSPLPYDRNTGEGLISNFYLFGRRR